MSRIGRTLYRSLVKEIRFMAQGRDQIWLNERLDPHKMGWKWFPGGHLRSPDTQFDVLEKILPLNNWRTRAVLADLRKERQDRGEAAKAFTEGDLLAITRNIFESKKGMPVMDEDVDEGFLALRTVIDQRRKTECSSCSVDRDVTVCAMSYYSLEDSRKRGSHLFAYRVVVRNNGSKDLRLIGRHWYIVDANGDTAGELPEAARYITKDPPMIKAGQSLEYRSGVDLPTDFGRMSGFLYMEDTHGDKFHLLVEPFALKAVR